MRTTTRRQFIADLGAVSIGLPLAAGLSLSGGPVGQLIAGNALASGEEGAASRPFYREAKYYEKLAEGRVRCLICPRKCVVGDGERGYCDVRENVGGKYYTVVYGRVCTYNVDPIEKKPFFHFLPGSTAFSLATVGCNLDCKFCQNWEISQEKPENIPATDMPPAKVVEAAERQKAPVVAYTYTEPTVYYEFMLDTARASRARGLRNVMVSGGYINVEPLLALAREMDAIKIDLKGFTPKFYADTCNGTLPPVLDAIAAVRKAGTWLEIVCLLIPTLNDGEREIDAMAKWLVGNVGADVPVHFTRFYPTYKLANLPPTPVATVERARQIAMARGLKYVYVGNVPARNPGESTYCGKCGDEAIERAGFTVLANRLHEGRCLRCNAPIPGVWS